MSALISLDDFIKLHNGKFLEVAGRAKAINQCADLANGIIRDVFGLPIIVGTDAVNFPIKAGDKYEWIINDGKNIPIKADLAIWKKPIGLYVSGGKIFYAGHIAGVIKADSKGFDSFDQNWPVGSVCHIQHHDYSNVAGWLRCKIKPIISSEPTMTDQEANILKFIRETQIKDRTTGLMRPIVEGDVREGIGYVTDNIDKKVKDLESQNQGLTLMISTLNGNATVEGKTALEWQTEAKTANDKLTALQEIKLQDRTDKEILHEALDRILLMFKK